MICIKYRPVHLNIMLWIFPVLVSCSSIKSKKSLLDGVWQFKEGTINNGERAFPQLVRIKVFNRGKFDGYSMTSSSSGKTMNGTFKILNDSIYTETLIQASNKAMIGKKYIINYILRGNVMRVTGFYDVLNNGVEMKVNYFQTWKRVDYQDVYKW